MNIFTIARFFVSSSCLAATFVLLEPCVLPGVPLGESLLSSMIGGDGDFNGKLRNCQQLSAIPVVGPVGAICTTCQIDAIQVLTDPNQGDLINMVEDTDPDAPANSCGNKVTGNIVLDDHGMKACKKKISIQFVSGYCVSMPPIKSQNEVGPVFPVD